MTGHGSEQSSSLIEPRYQHPKVLGIDLSDEDAEAIRAGGFNLVVGSFGTPIKVTRSENYVPVNINGHLPSATEQEIVVADLAGPEASGDLELGDEPIGKGMWQQMDTGMIDPRPYFMYVARKHFDRIYAHGGIFILFADARRVPDYRWAEAREISYSENVGADNWSLLTALSDLRVEPDFGSEIVPVNSTASAFTPIAKALEEGRFNCVITPYESVKERWATLARSKYGDSVAGILGPPKDSGLGLVIVLPRVERKGELVKDLLENLLPHMAPQLFPEDERQSWADDDLYAPSDVAELRVEIATVRDEANAKVAQLESQIEIQRAKSANLRALLTATSDELVAAVKAAFESLGFADVRDVDVTDGVQEGRLREDLQIHADPPIILCEVKGINGLPRDEDALEVVKYILPRVREWDRPDVRGLTVVNHQRGLPPLARDANVFQGDQIENAEGQGVGLLTTFDLYRLARGFARNSWHHEDVAGLFTATAGRVEALPVHYARIGEVVNYFEEPEAVIVELTEGKAIRVGERVGLVGSLDFVEGPVTSIHVDGESVDASPDSGRIGLKAGVAKAQARQGTPVYLVKPASPSP